MPQINPADVVPAAPAIVTADALAALRSKLEFAWSRDTTYWPDRWAPERPSIGHCAVTALIVQERFGGTIMRGRLADGDTHYWNVAPSGETIDLTRDQFEEAVEFTDACQASPEEMLKNEGTRRRYRRLRARL